MTDQSMQPNSLEKHRCLQTTVAAGVVEKFKSTNLNESILVWYFFLNIKSTKKEKEFWNFRKNSFSGLTKRWYAETNVYWLTTNENAKLSM